MAKPMPAAVSLQARTPCRPEFGLRPARGYRGSTKRLFSLRNFGQSNVSVVGGFATNGSLI
jgi:hypothetical protein